jgi:microcystin-dependent protein
MPDPTTSNIVLAIPSHGSDVDTWDAPLNSNAGILDAIAGSVTSKSLTNAPVTLTTTECRVSILRFSGTLTGNVTITLAAIIKSWICENTTTGAFTVTISGGSGNVVALPPGSCQVYWDGTNVSFINLGRVGEYWDYAGSAVPAWVTACSIPPYLLCDASSFSSGTYPLLAAILGTTTLPDMRGRSRAFLTGGTGRITTAGSGIDGDTRFSGGGAQNVTLDTTMIPSHTHSSPAVTDPGHRHFVAANTAGGGGQVPPTNTTQIAQNANFSTDNSYYLQSTATDATIARASSSTTGITLDANTGATGGGLSHNNMPPACIGGITMVRAA